MPRDVGYLGDIAQGADDSRLDFADLKRDNLKQNSENVDKVNQRLMSGSDRFAKFYNPDVVADDALDFDSIFKW